MSKVRIAATGIFLFVIALTSISGASFAQESEIIIPIVELNSSGVSGDATLTDNDDGTTTIDVLVDGATGDHPIHLHSGTCAELGDIMAPLEDVDASGSSVTDVTLDLATIQASSHSINIHQSAEDITNYIACGDIPLTGNTNDDSDPLSQIPLDAVPAVVIGHTSPSIFTVLLDGQEQTVELIGVDAPVLGECLGEISEARIKRLAREGNTVFLESDVVDTSVDEYLLRYVWVDRDGNITLINEKLIVDGFAAFEPHELNAKYNEFLLEAQATAQENEKRIWSECIDADEVVDDTSATADDSSSSGELTAEELVYTVVIADQTSQMSDSLDRFAELTISPDMFTDAWTIQVALELVLWNQIYEDASSIDPPPRFAGVHQSYLDGLGHFVTAGELFAYGVDNFDVSAIELATLEMLAGTADIAAASEQVNAIAEELEE